MQFDDMGTEKRNFLSGMGILLQPPTSHIFASLSKNKCFAADDELLHAHHNFPKFYAHFCVGTLASVVVHSQLHRPIEMETKFRFCSLITSGVRCASQIKHELGYQ